MSRTFGSLFAGIGGVDLGLERAGWECRWQVEWDPFCQRVLQKHWPEVTRYGDITTVDWSAVEPVDLLAGGFPCQPISAAGKQKAQADDRWLWPEFLRAIRGLRPRLVLVENVRNILSVAGGSVFGEVLGDLAASGYDAEWDCIPASALGAPHQRDRLWLVAYPNDLGAHRTGAFGAGRAEPANGSKPVADASSGDGGSGRQGRSEYGGEGIREYAHSLADTDEPRSQGHGRLHCFGEGAGEWLAGARSRAEQGIWLAEPNVGRVANGVPDRVDRLRALGNAVVPQVAEYLGSRLK